MNVSFDFIENRKNFDLSKRNESINIMNEIMSYRAFDIIMIVTF